MRLEVSLFLELINIVSIVNYNCILYFLVILFAQNKEYMIWQTSFSRYSVPLPVLLVHDLLEIFEVFV